MIEDFFKQSFVQQKLHHMLIKRAALLKAENMIFAPGITTSIDNGINAAEKIDISLIIRFHFTPHLYLNKTYTPNLKKQ